MVSEFPQAKFRVMAPSGVEMSLPTEPKFLGNDAMNAPSFPVPTYLNDPSIVECNGRLYFLQPNFAIAMSTPTSCLMSRPRHFN